MLSEETEMVKQWTEQMSVWVKFWRRGKQKVVHEKIRGRLCRVWPSSKFNFEWDRKTTWFPVGDNWYTHEICIGPCRILPQKLFALFEIVYQYTWSVTSSPETFVEHGTYTDFLDTGESENRETSSLFSVHFSTKLGEKCQNIILLYKEYLQVNIL